MPIDEELDTEINDKVQSDDSRDEAQAPKSDRLNSQTQSYNFDTTTVIVSLQILPEAEETRQVLITTGIKGEPPIVVNATLNQITQSTIIAQALEQLKQALPQRLCCKNLLRSEKLPGKEFFYATTPKIWLTKITRSLTAPLATP